MTPSDRTKLVDLLRERLPEHTVYETSTRAVRVSKGGLTRALAVGRDWYDHAWRRAGPYTGRGWHARMATDITAAVRELGGGEG